MACVVGERRGGREQEEKEEEEEEDDHDETAEAVPRVQLLRRAQHQRTRSGHKIEGLIVKN